MSKPILITGASGTIGREIVKHLSARGAPFRAAVRDLNKARKKFGPAIDLVEFDFENRGSFAPALKGVEKLFILPPLIPDQLEVTNALVNTAKSSGTQHIVKLSAIGADADANFTVGKWHGQSEQYIRESGLPFTFLRPNSFMQNFINYFAPRAGVIYLPWGEGKASFVDARDVAAVATETLTAEGHDGAIYTLTGPEPLGIADVARLLSSIAGREIRYVDVPEVAARDGMLQAQIPQWQMDALMQLHAINKRGLWDSVTSDIENLTRKPAINFARFARDYAQSFRAA